MGGHHHVWLGSLAQGTIGFALGLIAVPLLVEAGFSLSQAVALTTLAIGIQVIFGAWQLRAHIPWDDVKPAAILRFLTVPLGVLLLLNVETMDTVGVKRLVGIGVLLGVILRVAAWKIAQREWSRSAAIAAFSLSGLLQGLVAMGGPPLVLWMTTRDFQAKQARAFTLTLFLFNAPVQVLLLLLLSQTMNLDVILMALATVAADIHRHDDRRPHRRPLQQAAAQPGRVGGSCRDCDERDTLAGNKGRMILPHPRPPVSTRRGPFPEAIREGEPSCAENLPHPRPPVSTRRGPFPSDLGKGSAARSNRIICRNRASTGAASLYSD